RFRSRGRAGRSLERVHVSCTSLWWPQLPEHRAARTARRSTGRYAELSRGRAHFGVVPALVRRAVKFAHKLGGRHGAVGNNQATTNVDRRIQPISATPSNLTR